MDSIENQPSLIGDSARGWRSIFNFRNRLAASFVLLALFMTAIVLVISFLNFRQQSREVFHQRLSEIVSIAALQQDGDAFLTIQSADDAEYERVRLQNLAIKYSSEDIHFLYTMRYDEEGIYFVVDAMEPGQEGASAYGDRYLFPGPALEENYRNLTNRIVEDEFYTDEYGTFLSAYAPIKSSDGRTAGIIGVDFQADDILASERNFLLTNISILVLTLPVIALLGWFLGNALASPIQALTHAVDRVARGDLDYRSKVKSSTPEIQHLDQSFNSMTQQLKGLITSLETRVVERTRDLAVSAEVSRRLSTMLDQNQLVTEVVEQVRSAFNYYHVQIYLFDEKVKELIMVGGTGEAGKIMLERNHKIPYGKGLVGRSAETMQVVFVQDTSHDPGWLSNSLLPETCSEVAIPISSANDILGVLDVQHNVVNGITDQQVELLQAIANQTAVAVQNSRLYSMAQRQAENEMKTSLIVNKLQSATTLEAVLQTALREVSETLGASRGSIQVTLGSNDNNGHKLSSL